MSTTVTPTDPQVVFVREPRNALGITAIILAVIGLLFGMVPLTGFIAFGLGFAAAVFALANLPRLRRGDATNRKTTWTALISALMAIGLGVWGMVIVFTAVDQFDKDLNRINSDFNSTSRCLDRADTLKEINACN